MHGRCHVTYINVQQTLHAKRMIAAQQHKQQQSAQLRFLAHIAICAQYYAVTLLLWLLLLLLLLLPQVC